MSILKGLVVDTKSAWVDYPGLHGFELEIATMSRPALIAMRKKCLHTKIDKKTRQPVETLDEEKFIADFVRATLKNWKGLTLGMLEQLLPIDVAGKSLDTEVPFTFEDAELLVKHSGEFDQWLNEAVFDLDNFRSGAERDTVEPAGKVAK
jgi:hypothetical protein